MPPGTVCELFGVTVTGNVQVQTNAHLNLSDTNATQGSTIDGNVRVETGAILDVFVSSGFTSTIDGNIVADQCSGVELVPAIVGGNVSIQNCTGAFVGYSDAEIAGNFTCNDNSTVCDALAGNVKGNVQINNNAAAEVFVNTIGGNLQCQGNTTITGSDNTVGGHEQGQCAGF